MKPFAEWTLKDAHQAVEAAKLAPFAASGAPAEEYDANERMAERRDFWNDGRDWPGPKGTPEVWGRLKAIVLAQFTPYDVVNEALDRVADGLLKREPAAGFAPVAPEPEPPADATDQQRRQYAERRAAVQQRADDVTAPLMAWWDREQLWRQARQVVRRARWAGRGVWRLWIPPGMLEEGAEGTRALPTGLSLADALRRVKLMAPAPAAAAVVTNPDTQERAAVFLFTRTEDGGTSGGASEQSFAEVWFLGEATDPGEGDERDTVVRVVGDGDDAQPETYAVPLGGRLPLVEAQADVLITDDRRRQQHALNFPETLINRILEAAGFPERYTLNAGPSGMWFKTAPSDGSRPLKVEVDDAGVTWYLHEVPRGVGASILTELRGFEYDTGTTAHGDGSVTRTTGVTTPGVVKFDPTDPEFAIKVSRHRRASFLARCHQAHVLANGEADVSGYSRDVARADHETDLTNTKTPLEGSARELLETVVAFVTPMCAGGPDAALVDGFLDAYRATVDLHLWTGPVSPDEQRSIGERRKDGLLSRATAMALGGVEDVDAEAARIDAEPGSRLAMKQQQADIMAPLAAVGTLAGAAAFAEVSAADVTLLTAGIGGPGDGGGPPAVTQ